MNKLLAASLTAVSITSFYVSPVSAQSETPECKNAIASVENQLTSGRQLTLEQSEINDRNILGTPPEGRPHQYAFGMSGSSVEGVMSSPVLLNTLATQIINNCNSISSVSFGLWQSGFVGVYGLLPNGEVEPFKCPEDFDVPYHRDFTWGEFCSL